MVEVGTLAQEHRALVALYGQVQTRCSVQLRQQAAQIKSLQAEVVRLRAALIVRQTALAWAREDQRMLDAALSGLRRRMVLSRRLEVLVERVQDCVSERVRGFWTPADRPSSSC